MKMSAVAVAAGLLFAGLGAGSAAQAQSPSSAGWHEARYDPYAYGRGYRDYGRGDYGRHRGWDRDHRRWNRSHRGYYGYGYRQPRCWAEWRYGRRVRVCR